MSRSRWALLIGMGWISLVAWISNAAAHPAGAVAESGEPRERVFLGLGIGAREQQSMSFSDLRPLSRGVIGGKVDLGYRIGASWWIVAAGDLAGAWFDFSSPDIGAVGPAAGNIEDVTWLVRLGLDREFPLGLRTSAFTGIGGQYGESRSWYHGLTARDEGPHVFMGGGYAKAGLTARLFGPLHGSFELAVAGYRAHARRPRFEDRYNWLGSSLEIQFGLRGAF